MNERNGFTVIELIVLILVVSVAGILTWSQINHIEIASRDDKRRTAINAFYYALEEVYYPAHASYPKTLDEKILPSVDVALFSDPHGVKLGEAKSNYRYEPTNCDISTCKSYTLRGLLEAESDYVKKSRNK